MTRLRLLSIVTAYLAMGQLTAQDKQAQVWNQADPHIVEQTLNLPEKAKQGQPLQAGILQTVGINLCASEWETRSSDGQRVSTYRFAAPGVGGLTVYYNNLALAPGTELRMYNPSQTLNLGPYTNNDNPSGGAFATGILDDDSLILELRRAPSDITTQCLISAVSLIKPLNTGFGGAGNCEVNINCTEGNNWQTIKKGVVRLYIKSGGSSYWCSGSLVNNTRNDHTPYLLTANHCGQDATTTELSQWIVSFNYEADGCDNPTNEPGRTDMTGVAKIAQSIESSNTGSDFYLVKLKQSIPNGTDAYFNGWSRENASSASGVTIHHPQGDIKKISTYTSPLVNSNWNTSPLGTHWEVFWSETANGYGVTEGGSSGSPLFNSEGQIVGQLTGGNSSCISLSSADYYGKIYYSWNTNSNAANQLAAWLDPDNTGVVKLGGLPLALNEPKSDRFMSVKPNPATGSCYVTIGGTDNQSFQTTLYDLTGRIVLGTTLVSGQNLLALNGIEGGVYILVVKSETADISTQRLIIQ